MYGGVVESGTEKRPNRQCHAQAHDETTAMVRSSKQVSRE